MSRSILSAERTCTLFPVSFYRLLAAIVLFAAFNASADEKKVEDKNKLELTGFIKESMAKKDLVGAKITVTDTLGCVIDTLTTGQYYTWDQTTNSVIERSYYSFKVPRVKATYLLEISMPEYQTKLQAVNVDNIGRREFSRPLPNFFLDKAPRQLDGVTVTASKIKFYNKGDTIVYNADAFELAEGSMLDALVKQLPGVELREGGQIYVNGEYVENLMLNGKDFFKGNNELMLDNLAAYTVKDIQVYKRSSDEDQWAGVKGEQKLTMDVKLKREYNAGWIINLEAGGGTSDRYMGRAFVNRFTANSRISFVGNINNLNDNRKPGESSTWTPQSNTTGTMRTKMAGLDYNAQHPEGDWKVEGSVIVRHTSQDDTRDVQRTNFLPGGDTYDYSFTGNRQRYFMFNTSHNIRLEKSHKYFFSARLGGGYNNTNNNTESSSASFSSEQASITAADVADLYSGDPSKLTDLINRTETSTLNKGYSGGMDFHTSYSYMIPHTNDVLYAYGYATWSTHKNEVWRDYLVNYGQDSTPAIRENQYFDNSPNRDISMGGSVGYRYAFTDDIRLSLGYQFDHRDKHQDSYMYALDRLAEEGIIGTLPAGYLGTLDASRSYRSRSVTNTNTVELDLNMFMGNWYLWLSPRFEYLDRNFVYFKGNENYHVDQTHSSFVVPRYSAVVSRAFSKFKFNNRDHWRHRIELQYNTNPTIPDPVKMIDVVDDTDPMNIWYGNPDLKKSTYMQGQLTWQLNVPVAGKLFSNSTELVYNNTRNALLNGYVYDTSTGVRRNRTYNVKDGNYEMKFHVNPRLQFGSKSQFTMFYRGGLDYTHSADMIGTDMDAPQKSDVYTYWQAHTLNFNWTFGKQQITFQGQVNSRYTNSDRANFNSITATHCNLMLSGQFKLPKGFAIGTDFTVYMRRGYGSPELDTTDPVWNARLSYTPPRSHWVIMLDGFDMLHQLSNVNYSVNAQGRTVTYTNVLPRYAMLHVQYRINIQPKRKIVEDKRVKF